VKTWGRIRAHSLRLRVVNEKGTMHSGRQLILTHFTILHQNSEKRIL